MVVSDVWPFVVDPVVEEITESFRQCDESLTVPFVLDRGPGIGPVVNFDTFLLASYEAVGYRVEAKDSSAEALRPSKRR